jgi:hypothetical protein
MLTFAARHELPGVVKSPPNRIIRGRVAALLFREGIFMRDTDYAE